MRRIGAVPVGLASLPRRMAALAVDAVLLGAALFALSRAIDGPVATGLVSLVGLAYFGVLQGTTGRTLGDRLAKIAVLDVADGNRIGIRRAVGRLGLLHLTIVMAGLRAVLGARQQGSDGSQSTWWDRRCGVVVVELGSTEELARRIIDGRLTQAEPTTSSL